LKLFSERDAKIKEKRKVQLLQIGQVWPIKSCVINFFYLLRNTTPEGQKYVIPNLGDFLYKIIHCNDHLCVKESGPDFIFTHPSDFSPFCLFRTYIKRKKPVVHDTKARKIKQDYQDNLCNINNQELWRKFHENAL
jgi:hypothetical protein